MIGTLRHVLRELRHPRVWVPLWLVLALGILNPAACLVHCAPSHAELHARMHGELFDFLCRMPPQPAAARSSPPDRPWPARADGAPASTSLHPDPAGVPRAVFACALVALALLPLLRVRRHRHCPGRTRQPVHSLRPQLPPPQPA